MTFDIPFMMFTLKSVANFLLYFFFLEIGRRAGIEITPNAALDLRRRAQEENGSEKR